MLFAQGIGSRLASNHEPPLLISVYTCCQGLYDVLFGLVIGCVSLAALADVDIVLRVEIDSAAYVGDGVRSAGFGSSCGF